MNIFYNQNLRQWTSLLQTDGYTFGKTNVLLSDCLSNPLPNDQPSFQLCLNQKNFGPLIGILTVLKKNGSIAGNISLFVKIQRELVNNGGLSIVFTPEGLNENGLTGYLYWPEKDCWIKVKAPLPHVVYNRIPSRESEQSAQVLNVYKHLNQKEIPYFNPHFLDKCLLYTCFSRSPKLKDFLPETILIMSKEALNSFLIEKKRLYIKPSMSSQGKGIYRLDYTRKGTIHLEGILDVFNYSSLDDFWLEWANRFISQRYIAQEEITSLKTNGHRFDFRILAHADGTKNIYRVTGVGIRQSMSQEITTHIATGGTIIPYESIRTEEHDNFIETIVQACGNLLTQEFGFFGEFSIDAGQSEEGNYFIYEINSKPMSFDEWEIETKRMEQLGNLFFQLSGFYKDR